MRRNVRTRDDEEYLKVILTSWDAEDGFHAKLLESLEEIHPTVISVILLGEWIN